MISADFIQGLRSLTEGFLPDKVDVYEAQNSHDGYGDTSLIFPDVPSFTVAGRLSAIIRIPGTPEAGSGEEVVGNFIVSVPVGTSLNKRCRLVINNGDSYDVLNVYHDKVDATLDSAYLLRIEH